MSWELPRGSPGDSCLGSLGRYRSVRCFPDTCVFACVHTYVIILGLRALLYKVPGGF